jgi:hypothetical protein
MTTIFMVYLPQGKYPDLNAREHARVASDLLGWLCAQEDAVASFCEAIEWRARGLGGAEGSATSDFLQAQLSILPNRK